MTSYKMGNWTKSTLNTLSYIVKQNLDGKKPSIDDIRTSNAPNKGTIINWIYVLKRPEAGFISDEDGLQLTNKGYGLFEELKKNPPLDRRTMTIKKIRKNRSKVVNTRANSSGDMPQENLYKITIRGVDLGFEMVVSEEKAKEIVRTLSEVKFNT